MVLQDCKLDAFPFLELGRVKGCQAGGPDLVCKSETARKLERLADQLGDLAGQVKRKMEKALAARIVVAGWRAQRPGLCRAIGGLGLVPASDGCVLWLVKCSPSLEA